MKNITTKKAIKALDDMYNHFWDLERRIRCLDDRNEAERELILIKDVWTKISEAKQSLQEYDEVKAPWQD